eukprot:XP_015574179.1 uncharacterized protein LOC8279214 isoform X1 [Ricinus communis]
MGLVDLFFNLALECFDVLAWPLLALGYPLRASIQAIETNSMSDIQKLITYWVSLSLILILEELLKLLEWLPFWHIIRLVLVGCLVTPYFDGSFYVYKHIILPCLSMDPQVVINMFIKLKESFLKKCYLLIVVERDVKEYGPEAMENLVVLKPNFEEHKFAKKDINAEEMTEKKETTTSNKKVGKIKHYLVPAVDRISAALEIKELTAAMGSCQYLLPDIPPSRKISKEWVCPICQVTTTSEADCISHLLGKRHKAASEKLKVQNQMLQSQNSVGSAERDAPKEMASAMEVGRDLPEKPPSNNIQEWNCPICQVTTTSQTVFISHLHGGKHDVASWKLKANEHLMQSENLCASMKMGAAKVMAAATVESGDLHDKSPSKNIQQDWSCPVSQVTSTSERDFISYLHGRQQEAACEKLKAKNQMLQNGNSSVVVPQEMATVVEAGGNLPCKTPKNSQEWNCPICQVTVTDETSFISHLQGRRHEAASKMLKPKNQILRNENSLDPLETGAPNKEMPEAAVAGDLPTKSPCTDIKESTYSICQVTDANQTFFISHLQGSQHEAASDKLKAEDWMFQSNNSLDLMETNAPKEMATAMEVGGDFPYKEPKSIQEWNCPICQVTVTNKTNFISHLQGRRHEAASRTLKAKNEILKNENSLHSLETSARNKEMPEAAVAGDLLTKAPTKDIKEQVTDASETISISHLQGRQNEASSNNLKANWMLQLESNSSLDLLEPGTPKETAPVSEAGSDVYDIPPSMDIQKEWSCSVSPVVTTSEVDHISHSQGKQHEDMCERLKAKSQTSKSKVFPLSLTTHVPLESMEMTTLLVADQGIPEMPHSKFIQQECTCAMCPATTSSETDLEDASEKLKAQKPKTTIEFSPLSVAKKCNALEEEPKKHTSGNVSSPETTRDEAMKQGKLGNPTNNRYIEVRDSVWQCTICNIKFNNEGNIKPHLNGKKHLARTREQNGVSGSGLV